MTDTPDAFPAPDAEASPALPPQLVDHVEYPVSVIDPGGRWRYLNRRAVELMGAQQASELLGLRARAWSGLESGDHRTSRPFVFPMPRLGRYYRGWTSPLVDHAGVFWGRVETMQDRTDEIESEIRMRAMFDTMPMGCDFLDGQFNHIDCNEALLRMLGLEDKAAYLNHFLEFSAAVQPDGRPPGESSREQIQTALDLGRHTFDWTYQDRQGNPVPTEITLIRIDFGAGSGLLAYSRDLRMARARDAEHHNERTLLRNIVDSCPLCFFVAVGDRLRFMTPFTKATFGWEEDASPAGAFEDAAAWPRLRATVGQSGSVPWTVRRTRTARGETREMMVSAFATEYYGESCVMTWLLDVTDIRQAEERMRIMLDATPLAVTFWDESLRLIDCNAAAPALYGFPDKRSYLDAFPTLSPPAQPDGADSGEGARMHLRRAFEVGRHRFHWMHRRPDGEALPAEITLVRMPYGHGRVVVGFLRDLRESSTASMAMGEAGQRWMRAVFEATPTGVVLWEDGQRVVDCNAEAVRMFAFPDRRSCAERFMELSPVMQPDGRPSAELYPQYFAKVSAEGRITFRWMHRRLDGAPLPCEVTLARLGGADEPDGRMVAGYIRDLRGTKDAF